MIEFIDVYKSYRSYRASGHELNALEPFNLRIEAGEIFGLIGHSGAGKSTLLRLINRLERPSGGQLLIDGVDLARMNEASLRAQRRRVGMIFQHFNLLISQTVAANIAFPLRLAGMRSRAAIEARVNELLARVGLQAYADKYPSQLSGGQKQRVGIARALANDPSILLCDEATSALDPKTTISVLELLADLNRELKLTIVLITHEMDVIRRICDRVAVLEQGRIVEQGPVADVFLHPQHAATRELLAESRGNHDPLWAEPRTAPGRLLRLTFRGKAAWSPVLSQVTRDTEAEFSLLDGRIDKLRDQPYGQLTVALQAANEAAVLAALTAHGVDIEELQR